MAASTFLISLSCTPNTKENALRQSAEGDCNREAEQGQLTLSKPSKSAEFQAFAAKARAMDYSEI
jgi:hypothetical protein